MVETATATERDEAAMPRVDSEAHTLTIVLMINAVMFGGEIIGAFLADSSALLGDSAQAAQLRAARVSGLLQLLLALGAFAEVARRLIFGSEPEAHLMVLVALAALTANVTCMWLLARHRDGGAHMKASWIFTANDVVANLGVIAAALLVLRKSAAPLRSGQLNGLDCKILKTKSGRRGSNPRRPAWE